MPTKKQSQRQRQLGIKFSLFMSYAIPCGIVSLHAFWGNCALAQLIPDATLGNESSTVTPTTSTVDQINGGATRGANLFHSFQDFNVGVGRAVFFTNPTGIENILTRVTGTNASNILGKLGILGNANLFLLNPNGIIFGSGASLDINGSFLATTANAFRFADGTSFSAKNPQASPLLTISVPLGLQFGANRPAAIVNAGTLAVKPGQNLGLIGGTVVSTGQLNAPEGQLVVASVPGNQADTSPPTPLLRGEGSIAPPFPNREGGQGGLGQPDPSSIGTDTVPSSSLPDLLAGAGVETGLTVNSSGEVELRGSGLSVEPGDVVINQLTAGTATISAANNLTLAPVGWQEGNEGGVSLQTTGDMNLLAENTVRIRDSVEQPFSAKAGGNLYIQGNLGIDILTLNHLDKGTPFQSGGSLSLVSDGIISGDAHFASGGTFEILNLKGEPGNFTSLYDPIISSNSDVIMGDYTGASLKVETRGKITAGNITITTPDTTLTGTDPDIPILTRSPALILRSGLSELQNPVSAPIVNAGGTTIQTLSYNVTNLGTLPGNSFSYATDINDSGQVVGYSANGSDPARISQRRAFLYSGGTMTDLGALPGGSYSGATGINNSGQVVGSSGNRAFLYSGGIMTDLGILPGDSQSIASSINNSGQVVGESSRFGSRRAFLYSDGIMTDLGTLPGHTVSVAYGINDSGQVVGSSRSNTDSLRPFLYSGGAMTDLGTLPGHTVSFARGINNSGQVVGSSRIGLNTRAFLYSGGTMSDLGGGFIVQTIVPTGSPRGATGINNSGQVVGSSRIGLNPRAFLYSGGTMIDLNNLISSGSSGWTLNFSEAINDSGQIVGNGFIDGQIRAFRADPVVTPTGGITVGNISTAGGPVILQGPIINLTGSSIASNGGYMNFDGPVVLNNNVNANSGGGNISFNGTVNGSQNLALNANTGNVTFADAVGGSIPLGNLTIGSAGTVNTGAITATGIDINASNTITTTGALNTSSVIGNGGAVSLNAINNITTSSISASSVIGTGGNISLSSSNGAINTTAGTVDSSSVGDAGAIALSALGDITTGFINAVGGNSGGDLNITSNGKFSSVNSLILTDTLGAGKAGDINIQTNSVALTDGTRVSASSNSSGRGGNLTIRALESVELSSTNDNRSFIDTDARASGDAGNLLIETGRLIVRDGSGISTGALYGSTGRGGNLTVNASDSVEVSGTTSDGRPSLISAGTAGTKPAGDLTINTSRLAIRDGGIVFTSTAGEGAGGNLTVNASESVELSGTSAEGPPSALSTDTGGSAKAGDLTINTSRFIARDGAAASVSTFGSGQGGNLILNASESVDLSGTSAKGFASGLLAQGFSAGNAGDLRIYTEDLRVQNRAKVTVAAGSLADTSVLTTRSAVDLGDGVNISIPTNFQAIGDAGTLKVEANRIYLNNQGSLLASTDSGEGGNIELTARDLILMRHNSLISAEARGGTRNGGNITINTPFVVGVPKEDSDIVADANQGRGGNIYITVEGIYGLRFRPRRTGKSDITASSNVVGQEGTVQINASFDPTQGLTNLPLDLAEAPMEDSCQTNRETGSRFVVTGRGGLPPNPDDSLSSDPELVGLVTPAQRTQKRPNLPVSNNSTRSTPTPVVEAQSWQFDANGNVVLTALAPNVMPQTPWLTPADCHKHSNAELQSK